MADLDARNLPLMEVRRVRLTEEGVPLELGSLSAHRELVCAHKNDDTSEN